LTGKRALVVALLVGGLAALAPLPAAAGMFRTVALPRSTVDRPDDRAGLQVHVVYAVPSDGVDRAFDTSGGIESSTGSYQTWLSGQTGGRVLRMDTFQGSLDITFQRLPRPDAEYVARGRGARDLIEQDLRAAGLVTWRKVYPVYYDGANDLVCGGAAWPPALPGTVSAFYLRSVIPGLLPCFASGFAGPGEPPRYTEFAVLHDFVHDLGIVGPCAPHFWDAGHVNESPNDLMWSGTGSWTPSILDVGRDDYFQAHIPGCPDLDTSGFLTSDADFPLTVAKVGSGTGTVASSPWSVIDCGTTCSAPYGRGTVVTLTARPEGESTFAGWGAPCSGTGSCSVPIDAAKTVMARFNAPDREVIVETLGSGKGTVTSVPTGLRCPPGCSALFPGQSRLELRAKAGTGSRFTGWSQDCSGKTCSFTLDQDKYVQATFADVQAPRVRALPSRGRRGGLARLRYRVSENTGVARVTIRVDGRAAVRTPFRRLSADRTYVAKWRVPRSIPRRGLRFCVRATDRSRHASRRRCATLTLR
jgi:Divergent InlB B-repeat domain